MLNRGVRLLLRQIEAGECIHEECFWGGDSTYWAQTVIGLGHFLKLVQIIAALGVRHSCSLASNSVMKENFA